MGWTIGVVVTFLIALPAMAHAAAFTTSVTLDLTTSFNATITPVTLNIGDSLTVDLAFADSQVLQVSNNAAFENADFVFRSLVSGNYSGNVSFDLSGLSGDFLASLPSSAPSSVAGGGSLFGGVFGNLTNSSFTFTDVHASLTLTAGGPFVVNQIRLEVSTPNSVLTPSAVSQPEMLLLLAVGGLASFVAMSLRRRSETGRRQ